MTTEWYASRAVRGACQLAGYLDSFARSSQFIVQGYLVILDARRFGLSDTSVEISLQNGMYYEHKEIEFPRAYHEERTDFNEPLRMFAAPICQ